MLRWNEHKHTAIRLILTFAIGFSGVTSAQLPSITDLPTNFGTPGVSAASPPEDVHGSLRPSDLQDALSGASTRRAFSRALGAMLPEESAARRGTKEAQLYRRASPSVVLIVTDSGIGSGAVVDRNGSVITNWHVVKGYETVGVVFKPREEGQAITQRDLHTGLVLRISERLDLALVYVADRPEGVAPLALGDMSELAVGMDVHAIGHPTGESWTYTKGVVSQIRKNYEWVGDATGVQHQATVIQTQTPINPGNSGGPLLSDSGNLVGINSFKAQGEGLNFAVAIEDVRRFLAGQPETLASAPRVVSKQAAVAQKCEVKLLYTRYENATDSDVSGYDYDCDGLLDAEYVVPRDKSKPIALYIDTNKDGKADVVYFDFDRDEKWDLSFYDTHFDGHWDLVGYHPDGTLKASRFEPYADWAIKNKVSTR